MPRYRFASFEVRTETGEVFKCGYRIRMQPQPFQLLRLLLERPGELVTRQELVAALWGSDTWTDAEQGLNIAVKKLRDALNDSAEEPRLIETLPRRGYRFIGTLEVLDFSEAEPDPAPEAPAVEPAQAAPHRIWLRGRQTLVAASAAGALLFLAAAGAYRHFSVRPDNASPRQQLSVLVGLFANETGERELDGLVENALEAELTASPFLSVASGERVRDALRLMRQPPVDRVPIELAQEVGRRDPGIRAMIAGSVRRVGSGYLLTARIVSNGSGEAPSVLQESAENRDGILSAVSRLATAVHRRLGSHPPASGRGDRPPDRVTTASLDAYRLYTDANDLAGDGNFKAAELLLRKALELDPRFASAYILLAYEIRNQAGRTAAEYMPLAERALALSGETSEEEAYFIRASCQYLRGEHRQAIETYEAMLQRYPEHGWANNNLYRLYLAEGFSGRMKQLIDRHLKIRPNDPAGYYRAGFACLCSDDGAPQRALEYADRGQALAVQRGDESGWADADTHLRALAAWVEGNLGETRRRLESDAGADTRAAGYLTLGMYRQAEAASGGVEDATLRNTWTLWRALLAGDSAEASGAGPAPPPAPATESDLIALLRAGRIRPSEEWFARLQAPRYGQAVRQIARGELTFRQGRVREAIETLKPAVESISHSNLKERLLGAMTLAEALLATGRAGEAAAILESATARRGCGGFYSAMFWPPARRQLAEVYRQTGRIAEAEQVKAEVERLSLLSDGKAMLAAGQSAR